MKTTTLEKILHEVKSLRREISLFLPTESVDDFLNKDEILASLKRARS